MTHTFKSLCHTLGPHLFIPEFSECRRRTTSWATEMKNHLTTSECNSPSKMWPCSFQFRWSSSIMKIIETKSHGEDCASLLYRPAIVARGCHNLFKVISLWRVMPYLSQSRVPSPPQPCNIAPIPSIRLVLWVKYFIPGWQMTSAVTAPGFGSRAIPPENQSIYITPCLLWERGYTLWVESWIN